MGKDLALRIGTGAESPGLFRSSPVTARSRLHCDGSPASDVSHFLAHRYLPSPDIRYVEYQRTHWREAHREHAPQLLQQPAYGVAACGPSSSQRPRMGPQLPWAELRLASGATRPVGRSVFDLSLSGRPGASKAEGGGEKTKTRKQRGPGAPALQTGLRTASVQPAEALAQVTTQNARFACAGAFRVRSVFPAAPHHHQGPTQLPQPKVTSMAAM